MVGRDFSLINRNTFERGSRLPKERSNHFYFELSFSTYHVINACWTRAAPWIWIVATTLMQRHWKSPAHPARHRRDYIIYRAVEDASPDGRTATWRKKYFGEYTSSRCSFADLANRSIGKHERENSNCFLFHAEICARLFIRGPR